MKKTINQIRVELNEIATKHGQINSFAWKDFLRAYKEKELNYPLMCAYYPTSNLTLNQTEIALTIIIADKIFKDWNKNLNEVESDTLQICRDIFNIINQSDRWQRIGRVSSCTVNKFIERGGDEVAGHTMTVNFLIRDNSGVCDIPIFDYDFDQVISAGCPGVNVFNSDLSYSQEVDSGDSLELPDITYNVKNSADTSLKSGTIPSVNNLSVSLDDVDNIDSDGSIVPTPAGVAFTCTPAGAPIGLPVMKTNITTSIVSNDDGATQRGRLLDFFTLNTNNPFGNTYRFTGTTGGYYDNDTATYYDVNGNSTVKATAIPDNIVMDWSQYDEAQGKCIAYYPVNLGVYTYSNGINAISALSVGSYVSGWFMWNENEAHAIRNRAIIDNHFNYPPFDAVINSSFTCTPADETNASSLIISVTNNSIGWNWYAQTLGRNTFGSIRIMTVSGTTIT